MAYTKMVKKSTRILKLPRWALGLVLACVPWAIAAVGICFVVFHTGHLGRTLLWLSGLSILLIAVIVGRAIGPIMFSLYGSALFLIFVIMAGPAFLQSMVLQMRGQTVQARLDHIVTDPAYPASTDDGCRSCSHTHGYVFRLSDGTTVRGYPYGTKKTLHIGDIKPVVIDPKGQIDSRSPGEVQPITNGIFLLIGAAIAFGVCRSSANAWQKRTKTMISSKS